MRLDIIVFLLLLGVFLFMKLKYQKTESSSGGKVGTEDKNGNGGKGSSEALKVVRETSLATLFPLLCSSSCLPYCGLPTINLAGTAV